MASGRSPQQPRGHYQPDWGGGPVEATQVSGRGGDGLAGSVLNHTSGRLQQRAAEGLVILESRSPDIPHVADTRNMDIPGYWAFLSCAFAFPNG